MLWSTDTVCMHDCMQVTEAATTLLCLEITSSDVVAGLVASIGAVVGQPPSDEPMRFQLSGETARLLPAMKEGDFNDEKTMHKVSTATHRGADSRMRLTWLPATAGV